MKARFAIERDVALLGGGGHGRVLRSVAELLGGWVGLSWAVCSSVRCSFVRCRLLRCTWVR